MVTPTTQQSAFITASNFVQAVQNQGVKLKKAILFGSHSSGKSHEWSDIDVALIADEFSGVNVEDLNYFINVTIQKPFFAVEPHTFNTKDFQEGNAFTKEIEKTGIVIF
jgi:uncharacterized protein